MDTYIFEFEGAWPIGAYLAIVESSFKKASERAKAEVRLLGFDGDTVDFKYKLWRDLPDVYVISNGDY